jgi:hypothetical protein
MNFANDLEKAVILNSNDLSLPEIHEYDLSSYNINGKF